MVEHIALGAFLVRTRSVTLPQLKGSPTCLLDLKVTKANVDAVGTICAKWSTVKNSNVVLLHNCFTTLEFNDSSVIIVSDYHPASTTVAEKYSLNAISRPYRHAAGVEEKVLWKYIVQIANALKAIHQMGLAARTIHITKVLVTDENRIRLNGCALLDFLDPATRNLEDLQQSDLCEFRKFLVDCGASGASRTNQLKSILEWLPEQARPNNNKTIDNFLKEISVQIVAEFDASLGLDDRLQSELSRELENSRVVRLMTKINFLTERPEHADDPTFSSQGPRALLPLFRDYVFHAVDAQRNPVVDMGHVLSCLNKLDVGIEEKIMLTTRDEEFVVVVSYKELKTMVERAWADLLSYQSKPST